MKIPSYLKKPIEKIYENETFIVFNKPAGLLVIPTSNNEKNTLVNIVNYQHRSGEHSWKLHPCHRLDRETSGTIVFAKGKANQKLMMEMFRLRKVKKTYIAFVQGTLKKNKGELTGKVKNLDRQKFKKQSLAKSAITRYKVIGKKSKYSIVEVQPITGRTNQIRIQFSQIGHPLLGDRKYSIAKNFPCTFRRTALHAKSLEWDNPVNHKKINVTLKLPNDMEVFIARNRN